MTKEKPTIKTSSPNTLAITILISAILVAASIIYYAERGGSKNSGTAPSYRGSAGDEQVAQQPQAPAGPVTVSIDDDAIMGSKDAPITIVEFSDFECPFCGRFFKNTLPQLKKDYIDTGKVRLVYRDLPLGFHEPAASTEAIAAECAREQGGDDAFFKYHDAIFNTTPANGVGIKTDKLVSMAGDLGLDTNSFKTCLTTEKYKEEVQNDLRDAQSLGATGTPTFFIGKTNKDGKEFQGEKIVGAQPYSVFKAAIDKLLDE